MAEGYTAMLMPPTILEGWLPPNRANWELIVWAWQFFPIFTAVQWLTDFYPQGKTSVASKYNINGHVAWFLMEIPGMITAWYCFLSIPPNLPEYSTASTNSLNFNIPKIHPWIDIPDTWANHGGRVVPPAMKPIDIPIGNKTLLGMFTIHYIYRAILCPIINPSMSPIHPFVFVSAFIWQVLNGLSIGGYIAGYGKSSVFEWAGRHQFTMIGLIIWGWAWLGNMFHDDELREIRREAARRQTSDQKRDAQLKKGEKMSDGRIKGEEGAPKKVNVSKVYMMPENGLFKLILYPHYLCEWIEWAGFWMVGGLDFVPGRTFLINEISTMLPRALSGWRWYLGNFGREKIGTRKAVVPYLL